MRLPNLPWKDLTYLIRRTTNHITDSQQDPFRTLLENAPNDAVFYRKHQAREEIRDQMVHALRMRGEVYLDDAQRLLLFYRGISSTTALLDILERRYTDIWPATDKAPVFAGWSSRAEKTFSFRCPWKPNLYTGTERTPTIHRYWTSTESVYRPFRMALAFSLFAPALSLSQRALMFFGLWHYFRQVGPFARIQLPTHVCFNEPLLRFILARELARQLLRIPLLSHTDGSFLPESLEQAYLDSRLESAALALMCSTESGSILEPILDDPLKLNDIEWVTDYAQKTNMLTEHLVLAACERLHQLNPGSVTVARVHTYYLRPKTKTKEVWRLERILDGLNLLKPSQMMDPSYARPREWGYPCEAGQDMATNIAALSGCLTIPGTCTDNYQHEYTLLYRVRP